MKRKRYTEAPTAGLGFTAYAPAPLRNASRAGCVSTALPRSRVEPRLNGIDHHRGDRNFLIEGVLANALVKIDRKVNRSLAEALPVLRTNESGQHRSQPAWWYTPP